MCCFSSIELFQKMCDELKDWMGEKINGINLDDVGKDLASVKVLQRKQQNLEQELKPIEEKLNKMNMMANVYIYHLLISVCYVSRRDSKTGRHYALRLSVHPRVCPAYQRWSSLTEFRSTTFPSLATCS